MQAWTLYDRQTCARREGVRKSSRESSGLRLGAGLVSKAQNCFMVLSVSVVVSAMGITCLLTKVTAGIKISLGATYSVHRWSMPCKHAGLFPVAADPERAAVWSPGVYSG